MSYLPESDHPWGNFLQARAKALQWVRDEFKYSNAELAKKFSMDEMQVYLILAHQDKYVLERELGEVCLKSLKDNYCKEGGR